MTTPDRPAETDMAASKGSEESPLFARDLVAVEPLPGPVILIGLPRSGSSFLADVMSQFGEYFVFDDLYLHREAKGLGVDGAMTRSQLEELVSFLGWQLRARIKWGQFDWTTPDMSLEQVDLMDEALLDVYDGREPTWPALLQEWMVRLARHQGCPKWGYKAPQEFMHIDEMVAHFPTAKFIYLYRDPRRVMASMKYVGGEDGHPNQYHPLVYARYWKLASQTVDDASDRYPGKILCVRYEDLAEDVQGQGELIGGFLETPVGQLTSHRTNTSFGNNSQRKDITPTEAWLCQRVAGSVMEETGYSHEAARVRLRDLPDLTRTTLRFVAYQVRRVITDPAGRESVKSFFKQLRATRTQRRA